MPRSGGAFFVRPATTVPEGRCGASRCGAGPSRVSPSGTVVAPRPGPVNGTLGQVNDDRPRLPPSTLRVVLNLGPKRASRMPLPQGFEHPEIDAEWDEESQATAITVEYERGQLHLDVSADGVEIHYHRANGDHTDISPFGRQQAQVLEWATAFAEDVHALMPGLENDAADAAAWHDAGYTLYVCETEPAQLDLLDVQIEGEILVLPWLGAGTVTQDHAEGDNHPIELLWTKAEGAIAVPIARAWLNPRTEQPASSGLPGIDWTDVGLPENEALAWLEDVYLNHHYIEDPATSVFFAALERVGGLDQPR